MKVLSKMSVYGIRAMVYIASNSKPEGYIGIKEISESLDISFHYLTKILQALTQNNILESYRGPNGGVALSRPAEEIFLIDIVDILEGESFFDKCLLGLPGCGSEKPCPVHDFWKITKAALKDEFKSTSLAELGNKVSIERLRLVP